MYRVPLEVPAAERARWLADLSTALDQAQQLLHRLQIRPEQLPPVKELYLRIAAARLEVQSLSVSRSVNPRQEHGPDWIESEAWLPRQHSAR